MAHTHPKVSVIIPVYNDERYMRDCLNALQTQSVRPYEVVVIDNNCSDSSIQIATEYPFVKVIYEKRQGLSFARNAGFKAAKGEILLRIDADTVVPKQYIETLQGLVVANPEAAGFTGYGISRYEFIPKISFLWSWCYFTFTKGYLGYPVLWGANMAIRKKYWNRLEPHLINNDLAVHEDQDVSLALASVGGCIVVTRQLTVSVQMKAMLRYGRYRKYGLMLQLLKRLDREHERYQLTTRLPRISWWRRFVYWMFTIWAVYGYYLVTFVYAVYSRMFSR